MSTHCWRPRSGDYWLATDGGLTRFDPDPAHQRFTNYIPSQPAEAALINALIEEDDGTLLLGTHGGLFRFSARTAKPVFEPVSYGASIAKPGTLKIMALTRDVRGHLWLGTENGLFEDRKNGEWQRYGAAEGLPSEFSFSFSRSPDDRLWVGFRGGFGRVVAEPQRGLPLLELTQTLAQGLPFKDVRAILFASDDRRWMATDIGLVEWLQPKDGRPLFRHYQAEDGVPADQIRALAEDSAGNVWVGTRRNGLMSLARTRFKTLAQEAGLHLSGDQMLLTSQSGKVCIFDVADRGRRIYCEDDSGERFVTFNPALPPAVLAIAPFWLEMAHADPRGGWWMSSDLGTFRFPILGKPHDLLLPSTATRFFRRFGR